MSEAIRDWMQKAEQDLRAARLLLRPSEGDPLVDAVCFHCQQCIEKYLKAVLLSYDIPFEKTHNLSLLLDLVLEHQPLWEAWRSAFILIKNYAVEFRYPGEFALLANAQFSLEVASKFATEARSVLELQ